MCVQMNADHAIESLVEFRHHGLGNLRDGVRPNTCLDRKMFSKYTEQVGPRHLT
jgi:hypothetical protein